jgi:putative hydrolase of the HAD superfamily
MTNFLPKAVLLDLDDTILAYDAVVEECWRAVCDRFAHQADGRAPEQLQQAIMGYAAWYWGDPERAHRGRLRLNEARREIVGEALRRIGIEDTALADDIAQGYIALREGNLRPFPGATETLECLRERGARLALLTNGGEEMQRAKIEKFGLARFFDCIVIEGAFGCGKPDPRVYEHALECLDAAPAGAWMVGDNLEADVAGAQQAGIFAIWNDFRGTGLPPDCPVQPDRIIRSLTELVQGDFCEVSRQKFRRD